MLSDPDNDAVDDSDAVPEVEGVLVSERDMVSVSELDRDPVALPEALADGVVDELRVPDADCVSVVLGLSLWLALNVAEPLSDCEPVPDWLAVADKLGEAVTDDVSDWLLLWLGLELLD